MKNIKFKKGLIALLSVLVLGLFLVACGDGDDPEPEDDNGGTTEVTPEPTPEPEDEPEDLEPVELTIAWWGGEVRHDLTMEVIALFEERYPHLN